MADGSRSCGAALQQWGGQWWSSDEKEGEWQKWEGTVAKLNVQTN